MSHMLNIIQSVSALEACVGKTPGPRDLKVIDFLDEEALRWISASPCLFISLASRHDIMVQATIAGGEPGFVKGSARFLTLQRDSIDRADSIGKGDGWGSLFVIPSLKESLRVNGTVTEVSTLSLEGRREEIARMLGSEKITPAAIKNAKDLMESAEA